MKKSKIIIAIVLAVVLFITVLNMSTFSWFTRPYPDSVLTGEKMMLENKNGYYAYNGKNVSITTKSSSTGVHSPEDTYTTNCNTSGDFSGSGLQSSQRKYFCTTITNGSGTDQNVSLYARTLSIPTSNNGTLALGVNEPTRSYHDYSALATPSTKTTRDSMRIYFEKDNNVSGWNGTEFYICWNEDTNTSAESLDGLGSNGTYYKLTHVGGDNNPNQYYADIPKTATHAFFAVENFGTINNGNPNWGQRSQTLYNLAGDGQSQTSSKLYKITSDTNSNGNHMVHTPPYTVTGNCINTYYEKIFVAIGNTFNAKLSSGEYIGTLKFYSSNTSIFTVNETTGVITPVAAGDAILRTKSTGGSYPDEQVVETAVHVTADANYVFNDVPIVKNIKIPATVENNANVVKVYWYVINNSKTTALSYNIDNVYVGL